MVLLWLLSKNIWTELYIGHIQYVTLQQATVNVNPFRINYCQLLSINILSFATDFNSKKLPFIYSFLKLEERDEHLVWREMKEVRIFSLQKNSWVGTRWYSSNIWKDITKKVNTYSFFFQSKYRIMDFGYKEKMLEKSFITMKLVWQ